MVKINVNTYHFNIIVPNVLICIFMNIYENIMNKGNLVEN